MEDGSSCHGMSLIVMSRTSNDKWGCFNLANNTVENEKISNTISQFTKFCVEFKFTFVRNHTFLSKSHKLIKKL